MTNEELWQAALGEIELSISKANFITWFKNTRIVSNDEGRFVIGVPNGFAKEWLENKYKSYILRALQNLHAEAREIRCLIYGPQEQPISLERSIDAIKSPVRAIKSHFSENAPIAHPPVPAILQETNINPRYTFDNFIVGDNNELARAACYAVSQNLGHIYNPLFIYGGVGLGKTHLLQSIGNEITKKTPEKVIRYMTSERFATDLIESIKNQTVSKFKEAYQQIDLLIIDDVQFLAGKEKTQNEFFHVFNALYQLNKQIVISSDRPPKNIPTLEERLRSRFEGGMIADISRPDLETRMAILKAKTVQKGFPIEDEVIEFVAENIKSNIRELEGALNKIMASCQLENKLPTREFVEKTLSDIISSGKRKNLHFGHIIEIVSSFYNINRDDLLNKGRKKEIARIRQIAMFIMRTELNASYPGIGEQFGGRDHTTALHAYEKINRDQQIDFKLKEEIKCLRDKLYEL